MNQELSNMIWLEEHRKLQDKKINELVDEVNSLKQRVDELEDVVVVLIGIIHEGGGFKTDAAVNKEIGELLEAIKGKMQ